MVPAVWPEANGQYADPVKAVKNAILAGRVTGVFLDSDAVWKRSSGSAPQWAKVMTITHKIGQHIFYVKKV